MRSAGESLQKIVWLMKRAAALEATESSLSSNKGFVAAEGRRTSGKRGPAEHTPIEGRHPESTKSILVRQLDRLATYMEQVLLVAEQDDEYISQPPRRASPQWEARRKAVLAERDVAPVALAFLYGYTDSRQVRELRIRHGLDEHSGRPLRDDQKPIISTPGRARK